MTTRLEDKIKSLTPRQRGKAEVRAAQLIAEEMTLRKLRHARKLTQIRMAKTLEISQDSVSRLEKRSDLLLSTLRKTVVAMGGKLSLIAEFPGHRAGKVDESCAGLAFKAVPGWQAPSCVKLPRSLS